MHGHRRLWVAGIVISLACFTGLAVAVGTGSSLVFDAPVMIAIASARSEFLDAVMRTITWAGSYAAALATAAAAAFLWRVRGSADLAFRIVVAVGGAAACNTALKVLFARPRPDIVPLLVTPTTYSFPSGHVAVALAIYGTLAVLLWRRARRASAVSLCAVIALVALSRIYLGVHYPSDVLGSLTLGIPWLYLVTTVRVPRIPTGTPQVEEQTAPPQARPATQRRTRAGNLDLPASLHAAPVRDNGNTVLRTDTSTRHFRTAPDGGAPVTRHHMSYFSDRMV